MCHSLRDRTGVADVDILINSWWREPELNGLCCVHVHTVNRSAHPPPSACTTKVLKDMHRLLLGGVERPRRSIQRRRPKQDTTNTHLALSVCSRRCASPRTRTWKPWKDLVCTALLLCAVSTLRDVVHLSVFRCFLGCAGDEWPWAQFRDSPWHLMNNKQVSAGLALIVGLP